MKYYDLAIIGGGPAGYNCAEYASKKGLSVALFEKDKMGGTCLNVGCIPTKSLLYSAKIHHYGTVGTEYGVDFCKTSFDAAAAVKKKDSSVNILVRGIEKSLQRCKVEVYRGEAAIKRNEAKYEITTGNESAIANHIIIASGSVSVIPPIDGVQEGLDSGYVVTSDQLLSMKTPPKKLVIVGGGVIGLEMGTYFLEAGSNVVVIEMQDKILGNNDREISGILQHDLEKKGMLFHLDAKVVAIKDKKLIYTKDGTEQNEEFDTLLLCVGRKPNTAVAGLKELGVAFDGKAIKTDSKCRTNVPNIYAIGDVNGKAMLAHVAYREGEVAVNSILGLQDEMSYNAICGVMYTQPEAAFVGSSEEQAKAAGIDVTIKRASLNYSGRHVIENGMSTGICKIIIDKKKDIIIGAAVMSAYASEYIYSLALMIQNRIPVSGILRTVFPHPTVCEIIRETLMSDNNH